MKNTRGPLEPAESSTFGSLGDQFNLRLSGALIPALDNLFSIIIFKLLILLLALLVMAAPIIAATKVALRPAPDARLRKVSKVLKGVPTADGMGVKLTRSIGSQVLPDLDPFLLLDEFNSHNVRSTAF